VLIALVVLVFSSAGQAETGAATQPQAQPSASEAEARGPSIEMPRGIATEVEYPTNAEGTGRVLVELRIDVDGSAGEASVLEGEEPFASAVLRAVPRWRFSPAKRGGRVVPARIRFLVRFAPPDERGDAKDTSPTGVNATNPSGARPEGTSTEHRRPETKSPSVAATDAPGKETATPPVPSNGVEVTVQGQRPEVPTISIGRADVEQLPGAFGDPFRAVEALPGVVPMVSGMPFFFIRGAPPGNQGYFIDGVRVPLLYHMAMGPGIVHPALIDRVDLYAGGYPAQYGRFAGAIVAAESKDPLPELHAQGSVRLVDSGAFVTAPFLRGSVALGGRYSYTAAIVSLLAPEVELDYWDYQVKTTQYLSDKDTVGIFALGSLDLVKSSESNDPDSLVGTEFHRVDFRYERRLDARSRWRSGLTLGYDKTLAGATIAVRDRMIAARSTYERSLSDKFALRLGGDAAIDSYDVILPAPEEDEAKLIASLPERKDSVVGLWADVAIDPTRNLRIVPGLRLDHYTSGNARRLGVEPRVLAIYSLRKNLRIVHSFGLAHQPPSFVVPVPGFQLSNLEDGLQRSVQSSAKVEWDLPRHWRAEGTLFQNAFFNLTDQLSLISAQSDIEDVGQRSRGRTFGMELSLRRSFSQRVGGFLSYTLSKSWRSMNGVRVPAAFDRRHVLQTAVAFDLGRDWRASARLMFYTGIPSTYVQGDGTALAVVNPEHLPRTPAFWRTDLRLQKRWRVGTGGAYWAFTIEALNATLNKEVIHQECSKTQCEPERIGPIAIPSLGVEAAY
jgi:TonB family protein